MTGSLLARLQGDDNALRREGAELLVEHLLRKPLKNLVDLEASVDVLVEAMSASNVQQFVDQHVIPGFDRHYDRAVESKETVGDALPLEARRRIEAALIEFDAKAPAWAEDAVDRDLLRQLFAPVIQETLLAFGRRITAPSGNLAGGISAAGEIAGGIAGGIADRIRKSVGDRADKLADAGKRAVGGISDQVDKRLQKASKDFSEQVSMEFREALETRLESEEGRGLVGEIRRRAFRRFLDVSFAELMSELERFPREAVEAVIGETIAHNLRRRFSQTALRDELHLWVLSEGSEPLGALLDRYGVRASVTERLVADTDGFLRSLAEDEALAQWIDKVITG